MDVKELLERIELVHSFCHTLCFNAFGTFMPISGNIGIFCQSADEFEKFNKIKDELTIVSTNPLQKYFQLKEPILIPKKGTIPEGVYTHLYVRMPDPTPYGKNLGDVDFVLKDDKYVGLKSQVEKGSFEGVQMYDRPGWNTIQIVDANVRAVAYVSTKAFAEKVRIKFD